jgi:hypothetical protein
MCYSSSASDFSGHEGLGEGEAGEEVGVMRRGASLGEGCARSLLLREGTELVRPRSTAPVLVGLLVDTCGPGAAPSPNDRRAPQTTTRQGGLAQ